MILSQNKDQEEQNISDYYYRRLLGKKRKKVGVVADLLFFEILPFLVLREVRTQRLNVSQENNTK